MILVSKQGVLLCKRRDVPLWDLPGGRMEAKETPEQCALREVKEETGFEASILYKLGEYQRPRMKDVQHLFVGEVIGGTAVAYGEETAALCWTTQVSWLRFLVPNRRRQLRHYRSGSRDLQITLKDRHLLTTFQRIKKRFIS